MPAWWREFAKIGECCMKWFRNLSINLKIGSIVTASFLGLAVVSAIALFTLRGELLDARQSKIKALSESAVAVVASYAAEVKNGHLAEAAAKAAALKDLRAMRYEDDQYFFVFDMTPTMLMHPLLPDLEGKSVAEIKSSDGAHRYLDMVEIVKTGGAGFYRYLGPKPGGTALAPKLSFIAGFAPWGWVVATGVYIDDIDAAFRTAAIKFGLMVLSVTAAVGLVSIHVGRVLSNPLLKLTANMKAMAGGNLDAEIPGADRRDEVGAMSQALMIFQHNERTRRKLALEAEAAQQLKDRRQSAMELLTKDFNQSVKDVLTIISSSAQELGEVADSMAGVAHSTSEQSTFVAAAAEQASVNVQSVALAAEQLAGAEAEISRQVSHSSKVVSAATAEAERTGGIVAGLNDATQQIGSVAKLISDIAAQTNLLALNATIEAARAGEAGKGFAVVANEVKNLANQTAKATEQINGQIGAVQSATRDAVAAISGIGATIAEIGKTATAITEAVHQQSATTREIARNVQEASAGTRDVSQNIIRVKDGAVHTGDKSVQVQKNADNLIDQARELAGEVVDFLNAIKGAGDRRKYERISVSLAAELVIAGRRNAARLVDVSLGGAQLDRDLAVAPGTAVELMAVGWPTVRGRIVGNVEGHSRVQFSLDESAQRVLETVLMTFKTQAAA
jgi:methyl-accepting chemotaxis protein